MYYFQIFVLIVLTFIILPSTVIAQTNNNLSSLSSNLNSNHSSIAISKPEVRILDHIFNNDIPETELNESSIQFIVRLQSVTNETSSIFCHLGSIGTAHLPSMWPLPFESPCETHQSMASGPYAFITPPYDIMANDFKVSVHSNSGSADDSYVFN